MICNFFAHALTHDTGLELENLQPYNPFATASYFSAKSRLGLDVWIAGTRGLHGRITAGCGLLFRREGLRHSLEIVSLPCLPATSPFWPGLLELCRRRGVTQLALGTFASPAGTTIPSFAPNETRRDRCEFVLDLLGDPASRLRSNHRRNVKKAQQLGVEMQRSRSVDALSAHLTLMNQSMARRRERGESVEAVTLLSDRLALIESGSGELFQAVLNGAVLSSVLVLHGSSGSYYQSAGTTPDGMARGASHFLVHCISNHLRDNGATMFGLGGADPGSSLARFKSDFGATAIPLQAMICETGPQWKRTTSQAIALARSAPTRLQALMRND